MLEVEELVVSYGPVRAVRGVSFTCARGEIVAIVGPNGAGKSSTLMALAGGVRRGVGGRASLHGTDLLELRPEERVKLGVVIVPERRRILTTLTVHENLLVAMSVRSDRNAARDEIDRICERFPVLGERASSPAGLLSGGQQQQLAIARALLARPDVLMLDEPSLGLAPQVIDEVFALVAELKEQGFGILLVEQNARRAAEVADRVLLLRQGAVDVEADAQHAASLDSYFGLSGVSG